MIENIPEYETVEDPHLIERRLAIDVGSGSTKVTIADVDTTDKKIVAVVFEDSFPVPYQAALEANSNCTFDENILSLGMNTFQKIKGIAIDYHVEKISAVATAAFRDAQNGAWFANQVKKETEIPLRVISQKEEGSVAFSSGLAASEKQPGELIVWDIGTGSFQISTLDNSDDLSVYMGNAGSIPFRNYIINLIQKNISEEVTSPNPMTEKDIKNADSYARSLGRRANPIIKSKLREDEITLIGIGRLFSNSIGPIGKDHLVNRKDLRTYISGKIGLSDEEQNNPYSHVDVSNAILVLAFMKALHIHGINIVDTKSTRGMLIHKPYWS